jgi:CRISPR-associated protein Cas2
MELKEEANVCLPGKVVVMFVILSYDVGAKRTVKVMKICRKYLRHRLESFFEGMLTDHQLEELKTELRTKIRLEEDQIIIYEFRSLKFASREEIGDAVSGGNII